jgi:hypothetical protein
MRGEGDETSGSSFPLAIAEGALARSSAGTLSVVRAAHLFRPQHSRPRGLFPPAPGRSVAFHLRRHLPGAASRLGNPVREKRSRTQGRDCREADRRAAHKPTLATRVGAYRHLGCEMRSFAPIQQTLVGLGFPVKGMSSRGVLQGRRRDRSQGCAGPHGRTWSED